MEICRIPMFLCDFCLRGVALVEVQLTELNDEGDGEPEGGDGEDGGEDPLGGPAGGLEAHQDVSCGSSIPHD